MELEKEIQMRNFLNDYQKAGINLIYTTNWLNQKITEIFKPYDITQQQFNILRILRGQNQQPATIKLLKERMLDKMSDVSRLVEKLRLKGLVDRKICESSRRNVDVIITAKGLELLSQIDRHQEELDNLLNNLSPGEVNQLNSLLDKARGT